MCNSKLIGFLAIIVITADVNASTQLDLGPKYQLEYAGAMRFKAGTYGASRLGYTTGAIAVRDDSSGVFVSGHTHHFAVGEYSLGSFSKSDDISSIPIAKIKQSFVPVKPNGPLSAKQKKVNRITGMDIIDNKLFVNVAEYYDAQVKQQATTVIFEDSKNLNKTRKVGYFELDGGAKSAGWMAPIPASLSNELGAEYLVGHASNLPINGRLSMGPSLYLWEPHKVSLDRFQTDNRIVAERIFSYSLGSPLGSYGSTKDVNELKMWNELSEGVHGFFSPSGKDYIIVGSSAGFTLGIDYKIRQSNGKLCGGYCAVNADDNANFFWIYSTSDIKDVISGNKMPETIQPSHYGKLTFFASEHRIVGADFNGQTNELYLMLYGADDLQTRYESYPLLQKYKLREK